MIFKLFKKIISKIHNIKEITNNAVVYGDVRGLLNVTFEGRNRVLVNSNFNGKIELSYGCYYV